MDSLRLTIDPQTQKINSQRPSINLKRPIFKLSSRSLHLKAKIDSKRSQLVSQTPNIRSQRVRKSTPRDPKSISRGKISTPMDQKIYSQRLRIDYQGPKSNSWMSKIGSQMLKIKSHKQFDFIRKNIVYFL